MSTPDAVADTIESVTSNLDSHNNIAIVSINLKKVFDILNENILKQKLSFYGIQYSVLSLIKNYLINRLQYVNS